MEMDLKTMKNKKRKNNSSRKRRFDNEMMLFVALIWLRHYPKNSLFSFFLGISSFQISFIVKKTLKCLKKVFSPLIKWPTEFEFLDYLDKFKNFVFDEIEGVVCAIDGTEVRVPKPRNKDQQKILWCRKKFFSINFQVIVLLNGEIIYVSSYKKSSSDQAHWNSLGLRELFIGKKYGIMGDGGYKFNKKKEKWRIIGVTPHRTPPNGELTEEQEIFNKKFSQTRIVVENTFSKIKNWGILSGKYRHYSPEKTFFVDPNMVFKTCCYLTQLHLRKIQLRNDKWIHPAKKKYFIFLD